MLYYSVWTIHIIYIYIHLTTVYILCSVSFNLCIALNFTEPTDFPRSTRIWFLHQPFRLSRKLRRSQQVPFTGDTFCIPNLPVNTSRMWAVRGVGPHLELGFLRNGVVTLDRWVRSWRTLLVKGYIWRWEQMNMFLLFFFVCVMLVVHSICLVELRERWFWLGFLQDKFQGDAYVLVKL